MTASLNHSGSPSAACLRRELMTLLRLLRHQQDDRERRQSHPQRVRMAMCGDVLGVHAAEIPLAAAAIVAGIAVEAFAPPPPLRHAELVVRARYRCEVTDHEHRRTTAAHAQIG